MDDNSDLDEVEVEVPVSSSSASHSNPSGRRITVLLASTVGRDRVYRAAQYTAKLLRWVYAVATNYAETRDPDVRERLLRLRFAEKAVGESRRVFRIGRLLSDYRALSHALRRYLEHTKRSTAVSESDLTVTDGTLHEKRSESEAATADCTQDPAARQTPISMRPQGAVKASKHQHQQHVVRPRGSSHPPGWLLSVVVVHHAVQLAYRVLDLLTWVAKIRTLQLDRRRVRVLAARTWLLSILLESVRDMHNLLVHAGVLRRLRRRRERLMHWLHAHSSPHVVRHAKRTPTSSVRRHPLQSSLPEIISPHREHLVFAESSIAKDSSSAPKTSSTTESSDVSHSSSHTDSSSALDSMASAVVSLCSSSSSSSSSSSLAAESVTVATSPSESITASRSSGSVSSLAAPKKSNPSQRVWRVLSKETRAGTELVVSLILRRDAVRAPLLDSSEAHHALSRTLSADVNDTLSVFETTQQLRLIEQEVHQVAGSRTLLVVKIAKHCFDLPIAVITSVAWRERVGHGFIGALGVLSSVAGLYTTWIKLEREEERRVAP